MDKDIKYIVKKILDGKWFIFSCTTFAFCVALVFLLFFYKPDYTSASKVYLSEKNSNQLSLGSLSSQFGLGLPLGNATATSKISLMSEVVTSLSFLETLLNEEVYFSDEKSTTLLMWLNKDMDPNFTDYKKIVDSITKLNGMINISENYQSSIINIEVISQNEFVAKSINDLLIKKANSFLSVIQNAQSYDKLLFISKRIEDVQISLELAENNLKDFRYKNLDINSSPDLQMKLSELVRDVTLQTSVMSVLMEQRELAKINNKDNSKFFIILEKANLPVYSSSSRRLFQLISYTIIGFIASVSCIVAKIFYKNLSVVLKKIFQ